MSTNWQELINYLKCENIEVKLKTRGNSTEIQGILFAKNGFSFSGSKIDKQLSYSKINTELLKNNHLMRNREGLTTQSLSRNSETSNLIDIIPTSLYNSIDGELNNKKKRKPQI